MANEETKADEDRTHPVTAAAGEEAPAGAEAAWPAGLPGELVRHGPGVPAPPAERAPGPAGPTTEEIWRTGLASSAPRRPAGRVLSIALSIVLIAASVVVICLRLTHAWS